MTTRTLQELVADRQAQLTRQQSQASAWNSMQAQRERTAARLFRSTMLERGVALIDLDVTAREQPDRTRYNQLRYAVNIIMPGLNGRIHTNYAMSADGKGGELNPDHTGIQWWHVYHGDQHIASEQRLDDAVLKLMNVEGVAAWVSLDAPEPSYVEPT